MATETVTISKEEYLRLKRYEDIDAELLQQFLESLRDIKKGNFRRVK